MKLIYTLSIVASTAVAIYSCSSSNCSSENCSEQSSKSIKPLIERADIPVISGELKEYIKAAPDTATEKWFTNDHCFIEAKDGTLHWFGINNPFPPKGKELYSYHPYIGHCTTTTPQGEWERHNWAIDEFEGTEYLGAPYVIWHEESSRYAMVLETNRGTRRLEVYWSTDLNNWEETGAAILPDDLWISSRDPHIMKGDDGKYWIHIASHNNDNVKQSQILRIKTSDFVTFEKPETILGVNDCKWATLLESPFVVERDGLWYLFFTYAHRRYTETCVVVSESSNNFNLEEGAITTLFGHGAELFTYRDETYITSCGPEDGHILNRHGVSIAKLKWLKQ